MNIVITGASRGIGKAIAALFIQHQHNVLVCSRNREKLDALKEEFPTIHTYACDISDKDDLHRFGEHALSIFDNIDVLVNNGGTFLPGMITEEADGTLEAMIHTNLYSAYYLTRQIAPRMKAEKKGYIINMCSIASLKAYENGGSYSISKFALLGFSKTLREELKPYNIKVSSIMPGATFTDSWAGANLPESRFCQPEDIAQLVYTITQLSGYSVVEDIVIRPQLGDI